jgi:hypothetical protein
MSQENVEIVERAVAAVNERDLDAYLACVTEDIEISTPIADFGGVYEGPDGIRRFFADLADTSPDFRISIVRLEPIGAKRVLAYTSVTARGRSSDIDIGMAGANIYDFANGRIKRVRIFLDRDQALEAAGLSE